MWNTKKVEHKNGGLPDGLELVPAEGAILKLEPGDILVLRAPGLINDVTAKRLKEQVESYYGLKCMVIGDGLELQVLRQVNSNVHTATPYRS